MLLIISKVQAQKQCAILGFMLASSYHVFARLTCIPRLHLYSRRAIAVLASVLMLVSLSYVIELALAIAGQPADDPQCFYASDAMPSVLGWSEALVLTPSMPMPPLLPLHACHSVHCQFMPLVACIALTLPLDVLVLCLTGLARASQGFLFSTPPSSYCRAVSAAVGCLVASMSAVRLREAVGLRASATRSTPDDWLHHNTEVHLKPKLSRA